MCGIQRGEIDPYTGRKTRLHVCLIRSEGTEELSNLRALCTTCNQGAKQITTEKPSAIWLLSQVRRAGRDEQRVVLEALMYKFGREAIKGRQWQSEHGS